MNTIGFVPTEIGLRCCHVLCDKELVHESSFDISDWKMQIEIYDQIDSEVREGKKELIKIFSTITMIKMGLWDNRYEWNKMAQTAESIRDSSQSYQEVVTRDFYPSALTLKILKTASRKLRGFEQ